LFESALFLALKPLLNKSKESAVVASSALASLGFNLLTAKLYVLLLLSKTCQLVELSDVFNNNKSWFHSSIAKNTISITITSIATKF
jgi:hypothetical protein